MVLHADGVADGGEPGLDVGGIDVGEGNAGEIADGASVGAGEAEAAQIEGKLRADSGGDLIHKIIDGDEDADEQSRSRRRGGS